MLIAVITAFLILHFGGHSSSVAAPFDQTTALIKKYVADETRQQQALALVDQMKIQSTDYMKRREELIEALAKLTAKRATPLTEIESAAQPLIADDRATAEKLLDLRFQLKSVLTADEWAKVFPAPPVKPASAGKRTAQRAATHPVDWGLV